MKKTMKDLLAWAAVSAFLAGVVKLLKEAEKYYEKDRK